MKSTAYKKPVLYLLLTALIACTKQTTWCERWQVEIYEKKEAICPTGRLDTVSVCYNSVDHYSMEGVLQRVDSVNYHMFKFIVK
jgi:hypothetical protein